MRQAHEDDALAAPFVPLTPADGVRLAAERWGLRAAAAQRLETERDDTFLVSGGGSRHVLKVANPADPWDVVAMQCAVLEHLESADPGLPVPRVVRSAAGETLTAIDGADGEARAARLLTWLPGRTLDYDAATAEHRRALGGLMARLSLALASFDHPGADRVLAWDLQRLGGLRPHLVHVADPEVRAEVEAELDRFDAVTAPALAAVRHQVVHNDANMDNVVVDADGTPSGILDFGDMVRTAVVADLAVAMAYAVPSVEALAHPDVDPWGPAYDLARGFAAVRPLTAEEAEVLPHLVRARMAQRMLVNSWLAASNPGNAHHTLRANGHAAAALGRLTGAQPPTDLLAG